MLLLTSTSDKLQVVTSAVSAIDVHASWVDNASGTITPGRTNTASITTATTTDVVGSPGASTQRNIKGLYITNTHASAACQVTVNHTDGTNVKEIMGVTLLPGENLNFTGAGEWHHRDAQGAEYFPAYPPFDSYGMGFAPTGAIAETFPRSIITGTAITAVTGTLYLTPVFLRAGQKVTSISFFAVGAIAGPTHGLFGLYDSNLNQLGATADFTTEAWSANTIKTKSLTSAYTIQRTGLYYIGVMVTFSTTAPTFAASGAAIAALRTLAPSMGGTSSTGLTTTLPNPAAAIASTGTQSIYGYVS
jgi:hypothetical protein